MNRNSVRKSPTPSAPHLIAPSASSAEPMLAATSMRLPSFVRASARLYSSNAPAPAPARAPLVRAFGFLGRADVGRNLDAPAVLRAGFGALVFLQCFGLGGGVP